MVTNNLEDVEKMLRKILPSHLWIKTQVAVLTDIKIATAFTSGELIIISEPKPEDVETSYPTYISAVNTTSHELITIKNLEEV